MPSKCKYPNCNKLAGYKFPDKPLTRCGTHKELGMVARKKIEKRICSCGKRACFNYEGEKKGLYCELHKMENMINVTKQVCKKCKKITATKGIRGSKKREYCAGCAPIDENIIDLTSVLCTAIVNKISGKMCEKNAIYGYENQKPCRCSTHAEKDMKDIKNKKCIVCKKKQPSFGTIFITHCATCKTDVMRDLRHGTEECEDCNKRASFGYIVPIKCQRHKNEDMKDLVNKKCETCGIFSIKRHKKNCRYCDPSEYLRVKEKEIQVLNFFQEKSLKFKYNKTILTENLKIIPDFLFEINNKIKFHIIVEVDEFQHNSHDPENELIRMFLLQVHLDTPCIFIRYNPNNFKIRGKIPIISDENRLNFLLEIINFYKNNPPSKYSKMEIIKLFFNTYENLHIQHTDKKEIEKIYDTYYYSKIVFKNP